MAFIDKAVNALLGTKLVKRNIDGKVKEAVVSAKKNWAEETTKVLQEINTEKIEKRKYVSTASYKPGIAGNSTKSFEAKELPSGKVYSTLNRLFSDVPGSVQCSDRIVDSVIGGGYVIEPVKGKSGRKSDLAKLIKFFDNPNGEDETIEDIVGGGIANLHSYGNWYIEKVKNKKGAELAEIYNLDSSRVTILVDDEKQKGGVDEKLGYQRLTDFNKKIIYDKSEVVHIKRYNPRGGIYGPAVLEANSALLMLVINALTYNLSIMQNGGVPPIQINLPDDSTEGDAEAVAQFYEANFSGPWNAGKPLVTFKGAKAEALGLTPGDVKYMELLEYGIRQVAGMYGVPLILVGIPEGTNRSTASNSIKAFYLNKIYPLRKKIAHKITQDIIVDGFGIEDWRLDFRSSGLEESDATRRDVMQGFMRGLYSFNETRVKMGLLPINEEWAKDYYLLSSKNDRLIQINTAIKRGEEEEEAEDTSPKNPDAAQPEDNRDPGEGADESDN